MTCYIAFHDWLQTTNCSRDKATVLIFKGYMHTCTMLYLLLLHRIFTNHIATICSNSSEMVSQQGLMNPIFAYHTKGLTFLPSRGLYCSWLTARTNLRPDSGQLRSKLQPRYLYHLESRWQNSHVLVHHDPLLSHLPLWCRYPWTCQGYSLPFCLRKQGALCGGIFARRGPSGFHCRASGMAWWVVFCASEVYGWDMSRTHAHFDPRKRLGDKCREKLADSKGPFLKQRPFGREKRNLGKTWNLGGTFLEPSVEPFDSPRWI